MCTFLLTDFVCSLPTHIISNSDVTSIINSKEVQSVLRPAGERHHKRPFTQQKNPLRNMGVLIRLNPYAKVLRRAEILNAERRKAGKVKKRKKLTKKTTSASKESVFRYFTCSVLLLAI
jgi:large subunit ribosomal protein L4e